MELKTLRDIQKEYCSSWDDVETIKKCLWTIEDFNSFTEEQKEEIYREVAHIIGGHLIPDLRQEAIKHYKKEVNKEVHTEPKEAFEWIEEFFNLTEEEME